VILTRYSAAVPARQNANEMLTPRYREVLGWVIYGQPRTPIADCGGRSLDAFNARTGRMMTFTGSSGRYPEARLPPAADFVRDQHSHAATRCHHAAGRDDKQDDGWLAPGWMDLGCSAAGRPDGSMPCRAVRGFRGGDRL
jgi:hypothetical protein